MIEKVATGPGAPAKQGLLQSTTDPPPDHLHLAQFTGLIWIESLTCRREMATRSNIKHFGSYKAFYHKISCLNLSFLFPILH